MAVAAAETGAAPDDAPEPSKPSERSSILSFVKRLSGSLTWGSRPGSHSESQQGSAAAAAAVVQSPAPPAPLWEESDENDDSEDEEEPLSSDGEDIVAEGGGVLGAESGRVLAPITKTTKLRVGVLEVRGGACRGGGSSPRSGAALGGHARLMLR